MRPYVVFAYFPYDFQTNYIIFEHTLISPLPKFPLANKNNHIDNMRIGDIWC